MSSVQTAAAVTVENTTKYTTVPIVYPDKNCDLSTSTVDFTF